MRSVEDQIIDRMVRNAKKVKIVKGCDVCEHEIINCLNHTHCSSLGYELICACEACNGTGIKK